MYEATAPARPNTRSRARRAWTRSWRNLSLTLPADTPELLGPIRHLIVANLIDWGADPERAGEIEVCASELLTNALRHSNGPARLHLHLHEGAVHLEVSDTSTRAANNIRPDEDARREHGRGLHIVEALAKTVGVQIHLGRGKTVKASFDLG